MAVQPTFAESNADTSQARIVLWIDDDPYVIGYVSFLLAAHGIAVLSATSSVDGAIALSRRKVDLIVVDWRLPDGNGLELIKMIRSRDTVTPVAIVSGYIDEIDESVLPLGVVGAWSKPLVGKQLVDVITRSLPARVLSADYDGPDVRHAHTDIYVSTALRRLVNTDTGIREFMKAALSLKIQLGLDQRHGAGAVSTRPLVLPAAAATVGFAAVERLEAAWRLGVRLTERILARELHTDRSELGRRIRLDTGLTYRQWRRGLAVQPVLRELITTNEQVAQIAFHCGYEHPSQLDREFRMLMGVSPSEFRRRLTINLLNFG